MSTILRGCLVRRRTGRITAATRKPHMNRKQASRRGKGGVKMDNLGSPEVEPGNLLVGKGES